MWLKFVVRMLQRNSNLIFEPPSESESFVYAAKFHVKLKGRFYITVKFEIRFWHCILQLGHESVIHFAVSLYRWHGSPSRSFYFQGILCQFYKRSLKFDELSVPRRIYLIAQLNLLSFTLFHATVPFLYPLKKPKELRFLTYLGGKDWPEMGEPKL